MGENITKHMDTKFAELDKKFSELLGKKDEEIGILRSEVANLRSELKTIKSGLDDADALERCHTLIFSGSTLPAFSSGEDAKQIIANTVKDKLKININIGDVDTARRMGSAVSGSGSDNRKIVVKLLRRSLKKDLIVASKKVNNLYLNEDLTPTRRSLLFSVRKIKREHSSIVKGYTTIDGRIYVFTAPTAGSAGRDVRHQINTREKLADFCRTYVKVELESFLEAWQA